MATEAAAAMEAAAMEVAGPRADPVATEAVTVAVAMEAAGPPAEAVAMEAVVATEAAATSRSSRLFPIPDPAVAATVAATAEAMAVPVATRPAGLPRADGPRAVGKRCPASLCYLSDYFRNVNTFQQIKNNKNYTTPTTTTLNRQKKSHFQI